MGDVKQDIVYLPRSQFDGLLQALQQQGYDCVGPRVRDGAILYECISSATDLPVGIRQQQSPGEYRLTQTTGHEYFAWANGPQAIKPMVFASEEKLWKCRRDDEGQLHFETTVTEPRRTAVIGARACDIAALYIHDRHFLQQDYRDPSYLVRRQDLFLMAVNCTHPAATCFCASTGDGPAASYGFDVALTELDEDGFLLESHSEAGHQLVAGLELNAATEKQLQTAESLLESAASQQQRALPAAGELPEKLLERLEHPRWESIAERCLSCGNCTAVCPTCFCHSEVDEAQLDGSYSVHARRWDSCFTQGHSYIHGITIRADTRARYRQWMTHKLATWHEQYGRSGCVGCGRCISWCPVGIDIVGEVNLICGEAD